MGWLITEWVVCCVVIGLLGLALSVVIMTVRDVLKTAVRIGIGKGHHRAVGSGTYCADRHDLALTCPHTPRQVSRGMFAVIAIAMSDRPP